VFQSLHLMANSCRSGAFTAGEQIAQTGDSGLGTGAHYDFRVKINGKVVPPETRFLESALTGAPLQQGARRIGWGLGRR
jgi:murein DD-endopeptidase MepM/ murein hydrolase activator NlpD